MLFVGVDLTSAFAQQPRAIDIAVLDDHRNCRFVRANWPQTASVTGRDAVVLRSMLSVPIGNEPNQVWAIDGPQGLASAGQTMRHCERVLGTPGHTPDTLPPAAPGGRPFGDYIRSSVDLFAALLAGQPALQLAGLGAATMTNATLYEIFPGSEWVVLAGRRQPHKTSNAGRAARRSLMSRLGVHGLPTNPTADENDAVVGAYLAWCTRHAPDVVNLRGLPPNHSQGELREGYILHAAAVMPDDAAQAQALPPTPECARTDAALEDDWASSESLTLKLTDYGLVQGTCPENGWMVPGVDYTCKTIAPDPTVGFKLTHAANFPGGRGWTSEPKVKPLLRALGYSTPAHLGEQNAVTLKVRLAAPHAEDTRRRRGVRISLREARELALRVMMEAERQVREERAREVLFLRGSVDEESSTHDL